MKRFIKIPEITHKTGIKKSQIYALIKINKFPAQLKIGRSSVWLESAIDQWIEDQVESASEMESV